MAEILDPLSWISGIFPKLQESAEIERKLIKTNKEILILDKKHKSYGKKSDFSSLFERNVLSY